MLTPRSLRHCIRPIATLGLLSCAGGDATGPTEPIPEPVATVTVTLPRITVRVGESIQAVAATLSASAALLGRPVTWSSDNTAIATVTTAGNVSSVSPGTAAISASSEGKSGQASLIVTVVPVSSITISPPTTSVLVGQAVILTASVKDSAGNAMTGRTITWVSSDFARGSVSPTGVVTGLAPGTVDIIASVEGKVGSARIEVTPVISATPVASVTISIARTSFRVGEILQAAAIPLDASGGAITGRSIVWASESPEIVTVSSGGLVTALNPGVGTISATVEGRRATANVLLSLVPVATITLAPASQAVSAGGMITLNATLKDSADRLITGRAITWRSINPATASVTQAGTVTGLVVGATEVAATAEGKEGRASITVNTVNTAVGAITIQSANNFISGGAKKQLTATLRDANGNVLGGRPIVWSTSDQSRATVSATGEVTASPVDGSVDVTATSEGKSATTTINILTFVRLSAGPQFTCGLIADGTAYCWGLIGGALPTRALGDNKFTTITVGAGHVCALSTTDGTYCWGNNNSGQLGTGTINTSVAPTRVIGGRNFLSIAAGPNSTCATNGTSEVYCWGAFIRRADPAYSYDFGSRIVVLEPTKIGDGIVAVVGGGGASFQTDYGRPDQYCGVDASGLAYCWLRYGRSFTGSDGLTTPMSTSLRFTTLRVGGQHVCGIATDKRTYCSGNNDQGQLGDGSTNSHGLAPIDGNIEFESLAAGSSHTCGITPAGAAYCWGSNSDGQLGLGFFAGNRPRPTAISGSIAFTGMRGAGLFTCGLAVGGAAYCWGNNDFRQLGDGTSIQSSAPRQVFGY